MKKPLLIIAVAMLLIIVTMGCKKDKAVTGVTLDKSNLTLEVGKTENLTATIQPNDATNKAVSWVSSNPVVASVVQGKITAIAEGTATITVTTTDGGYTAECVVTVLFADPEVGVVINGIKWSTRNVDAPGKFTVNIEDAGMFYQWNRNVGWSATDPRINSNGLSAWNSSIPTGDTWEKVNDPCPRGWRVPTRTELESLASVNNVWTAVYGLNGRMFGSSANTIFLPSVGCRSQNGSLTWVDAAHYWSATNEEQDWSSRSAWMLYFDRNDVARMIGSARESAKLIRCVAE